MKIGLIDYDLYKIPNIKLLNVEIMKLGTYYEEKGYEVNILSPDDSIFYYDKIIVAAVKTELTPTDREYFSKHPNIEFIGENFYNGNYVPFNIDELDYCKPQFKFYNNLFKYFYKKGIYNLDEIKKLKESTFIRIFPNNKAINIDKVMTGEKIYVVDNYIFDKDNWEEKIKYLSIFYKYFTFVNPQLINNIDDLRNFKKLVDYGFIGLHGHIRIENMDKFLEFVEKGQDILKELAPMRFEWEIAYSETNNYTEQFYAKEFYNSLEKVRILNQYGIKIREICYKGHTKFFFTNSMFNVLKEWGESRTSCKYSFNEYIFLKIKNKSIIELYLKFLNKHPEYNSLINTIYE